MKYVKDHSIGNGLLKDSVADAGPGKLAQQQSPSRLLLATQPIQLVNTPNNNRPPAPLESPPKRQRLQKAENRLKSEKNSLDDSPTKQLYNIPPYPSSGVSSPQHSPTKSLYEIPVYPSSGVSTPQHSSAKSLNSSPTYIRSRPRIPQYSPAQSLYRSPVYPSSGLPIPQQWQTTALGHLPSMNAFYAGSGQPISQQWQATALDSSQA